MASDDLEPYLEGVTRADEWRALRKALAGRLKSLKEARAEALVASEQAAIGREIEALTKQIETLQIEEVAAKFAEDALRFTIVSSRMDEEYPE